MIKYRDGYRYQLDESYVIRTPIRPVSTVQTQFIRLDMDGTLRILSGYAWDGPTGIWFFKRKLMRPSLVHDALYQLLRQKRILQHDRVLVDGMYRDISLANRVWRKRVWWQYLGVRRLATRAADPRSQKQTWTAP